MAAETIPYGDEGYTGYREVLDALRAAGFPEARMDRYSMGGKRVIAPLPGGDSYPHIDHEAADHGDREFLPADRAEVRQWFIGHHRTEGGVIDGAASGDGTTGSLVDCCRWLASLAASE